MPHKYIMGHWISPFPMFQVQIYSCLSKVFPRDQLDEICPERGKVPFPDTALLLHVQSIPEEVEKAVDFFKPFTDQLFVSNYDGLQRQFICITEDFPEDKQLKFKLLFSNTKVTTLWYQKQIAT